jgi:hypothetical protein
MFKKIRCRIKEIMETFGKTRVGQEIKYSDNLLLSCYCGDKENI